MSAIRLKSGTDQNVYYEFDPEVAPLGEGGMGRVFRGIRVERKGDNYEARDVAIKVLFDDLPESAIKRSRREASIRLKNDNLVEMIDFLEINEENVYGQVLAKHYHVISELLNGVNVDELLEGNVANHDGTPNPFAQELLAMSRQYPAHFAGTVLRSILSGIMALHDAGYIHRDIDPSNIMITSDGKIKLIDFGIARQINALGTKDKQLTSSGQFIGKTHYASPELLLGDINHQNFTTDVYALGIVLFQLAVGHLPFDGPTHEVYDMQLKKDLPLKEVEDRTLRKIIKKATEKKQDKRYRTATEFRVDLDNWMLELKPIDKSTLLINRESYQPNFNEQRPESFETPEPSTPSTPPDAEIARHKDDRPSKMESQRAQSVETPKVVQQKQQRQEMPRPEVQQPQELVMAVTNQVVKPVKPQHNYKKIGIAASILVILGVAVFLISKHMSSGDKAEPTQVMESPSVTTQPIQQQIDEQVVETKKETKKEEKKESPKQKNMDDAVQLMMNSTTAQEGLQILQGLADNGDFESKYLLSRLYFDPTKDPRDTAFYYSKYSVMKSNCGITPNNKEAHQYLMNLYQTGNISSDNNLKCEFYYQLGCDFLYGDRRGCDKNQGYALWCFQQVQQIASGNSFPRANAFLNNVEEKIEVLANKRKVQPQRPQ